MERSSKFCYLLVIFCLIHVRVSTDQSPSEDEINEKIRNFFNESEEDNPCAFGECVPIHLCAKNSSEIIMGPRSTIGDEQFCEGNNVCCTEKIEETNARVECGRRKFDGIGMRTTGDGDDETNFGEFPWMIVITYAVISAQNEKLDMYKCGGSLIHPSVVLTAAHCVHGKRVENLKIRAGDWNILAVNELYPHQERTVRSIIIHENYYKGAFHNDIALLILENPVELTDNVNTVCLPPQNHNFDGERCWATGWGKDLFGPKGKFQNILKKVELPIIPKSECQTRLRQTRLGPQFNLHRSSMCAGGEPQKDTCEGDGGSPLNCQIPGKLDQYFQSGIVSWGIGCLGATPAVYVKVAKFRNWIDEQFQYESLDTSYYSLPSNQ